MIVHESPDHFDDVRQLTIDAFAASPFGHNGEADLIDAIREQCDQTLSLVAIDMGRVVGHILFSPVEIRDSNSVVRGMGLAPMAVLPSHQRQGVGSMLVNEGLRQLDSLANEFTIVAGHRDYYPRFGFRPAQDYSVSHGFAGMPQDIFFIRVASGYSAPVGIAYYHAAFGPQHIPAEDG